ncbi:hypothetical protein [Gordonia tangerina]|uniref:Uncharacterized protein n=1 Tax=Gordonia tangerina TaxID=2911060 RepID=A0ABS9DPM1_9ACTN|nr:hypothetical protein [Gordonia tangerina]MCF3941121.1 hypothetical protein [Gordonia tangerina]
MSSTGTVETWHQELGWGVTVSADTPGGTSADSCSLRVEAVAELSEPGLMGLRPGTAVEFEWSAVVPPENGCDYVAGSVWPAGTTRQERPQAPFMTWLWRSVGDPGPDGLTTMRESVIDDFDVPRTEPPALPTPTGTVHIRRGGGIRL